MTKTEATILENWNSSPFIGSTHSEALACVAIQNSSRIFDNEINTTINPSFDVRAVVITSVDYSHSSPIGFIPFADEIIGNSV
jgi:hypothetical protein